MYGYTTTTGTTVGALASGTKLYPDDKLNSIIRRMVGGTTYKYLFNNANDVDTFLSLHNHNNNYDGLSIGDTIKINDGTYNKIWKIAGFDCEYSRVASDNTTYNNGYGICLIPDTYVSYTKWNDTQALTGGYISSTMHTTHLVTVANNLKNILGDHLVDRHVLLSSETNGTSDSYSSVSSNYAWTTSYCTLMSCGQLTGTFAQHRNKYDDGEANYKLPLFDYETFDIKTYYWLRNVFGSSYYAYEVFYRSDLGISQFGNRDVSEHRFVRPLIYLR